MAALSGYVDLRTQTSGQQDPAAAIAAVVKRELAPVPERIEHD
ncbi:hypothetical protein GCM10010470_17000 [Saccharopolyspora taberi]|uniref:Uncharacterized protein n=1 Tax=Saccharopolyspora taberi TaxID=60895 RepID=A0ABN3V8I2_9PSEU